MARRFQEITEVYRQVVVHIFPYRPRLSGVVPILLRVDAPVGVVDMGTWFQCNGYGGQQRAPMVDHDPAANLHGKSALVIIVPHLVKIQPLGDGAAVYPKAGKEHRVAQHLHQFKAFFSCVNGHSVLFLSFPHRFPAGRKPPAVDPPDLVAQTLGHTGHVAAGGGAAV